MNNQCGKLTGHLNEKTEIITINTNDYNDATNKPQINGKELKSGDNTLEYLGIPEASKIVEKEIQGENGTAIISNDPSGGILKFTTNDNKESGVAVNDGTENIYTQLYAKDKNTNKGARITLDTEKAYYTSKNDHTFDKNDEIVTKKDIPNVSSFITKDVEELDNFYNKTDADNTFAKKDSIPSVDGFIKKDVTDLTNYYNKTTIDSKIKTVYKYKGSVDTYDELTQKQDTVQTGDVWNVNDTDKNYAWTGSEWDNLGGTIDLTPYAQKKDLAYNFIEQDNANVWELTDGNYVVKDEGNINIQTGSSVPVGKGTIVTVSTSMDAKKHYFIINSKGSVYYGIVDSEGTAEENGNYLVDFNKLLTMDNTTEYEVTDDYNPAHKKYVDDEVKDNYYNLEKNVSEENKAQTIVNIVAKDESYSQIMNVDNIDLEQDVATIDVLGANKGKEMNNRIKNLENRINIPLIKVTADITDENLKAHTYPELVIDSDNIEIIKNIRFGLLNVVFTVTEAANPRTLEMVLSLRINDDTVTAGNNIVHTMEVNAITDDLDGSLIYNGQLMGNETTFPQSFNLKPQWFARTQSPVMASNLEAHNDTSSSRW